MASRQCHPTNPPPTWYKPPRMISISPSCNLPTNMTEKTGYKTYGANQYHHPHSSHQPTLNIRQKIDHDPKCVILLQATNIFKTTKSINMTKMHSNYVTRTIITSPSALTHPPQLMTNPPSTAHSHDHFKNHNTSFPPIQTYPTMIANNNK